MTRFLMIVSVMVVPSLAVANPEEMFSRLDTDASGGISLAEFEVAAERMPNVRESWDQGRIFVQLDTDGNGEIVVEEFEAARDQMRERRGEGFGGNREARLGRAFDMMDGDSDGLLSRNEFIAGAERVRELREGHPDVSPPPPPMAIQE